MLGLSFHLSVCPSVLSSVRLSISMFFAVSLVDTGLIFKMAIFVKVQHSKVMV